MKILIDINHPAHVHYFKNFIRLMQVKGHDFLVVARDREMVIGLLKANNIDYINRGTGANGFIGKLIYLIKANIRILKIATKFKPDLFLSFSSPYAAQVSKILRKPHIALTDTDYAGRLSYLSMVPFSKFVITSHSSLKDFGNKHVKVNSNIKLLYLHPKYYQNKNKQYIQYLNLEPDQKYIIVRFVAFNAYHDLGLQTLNNSQKVRIVNLLNKHGKVFISSESTLPDELIKYKLEIPPEIIHDVLANSSLFIGQSGTMAIEGALLGTPSVFIASENENIDGVLQEFEGNSLMTIIRHSEKQISEIEAAIIRMTQESKANFTESIVSPYIESKIDLTEFLVDFIEEEIKIIP